jgi:hypothetical protein
MRAFHLEAALAGAPVCTRDGKPVTQLFKLDNQNVYTLAGVVDEAFSTVWTSDGKYLISEEGDHDLFMAPVNAKKTGWIARYKFPKDENCCFSNLPYPTEEAAKAIHPDAVGYHEISWEE